MRNPIFPYRITAIVGANVIKGGSGGGGGGGVAPTVSNSKFAGANSANSVAITPDSSVTSGRLGVVCVAVYAGDSDWTGITAGMLTKTAGTSTIGTITLDASGTRPDGTDDVVVGVYSFPITGNGTLTMTWDSGGTHSVSYISCVYAELASADTSGTRVNATSTDVDDVDVTSTNAGNTATGGAGIIIGMMTPGNPYGNITITEQAAFSLISEIQDDSFMNYSFIYQSVTTDTTDAAEWTMSVTNAPNAADPVCVGVAYKSSTP